ncbi:MAG: hypothetical protein Q7U87_05000 [bacterium]|nr:hypothetical protein [bacterium]
MTPLAQKVLETTTPYLGPASKIFLDRQTKRHMNGVIFDYLEKDHLPDLSRWVLISAGLLIDKTKAQELSEKISTLHAA